MTADEIRLQIVLALITSGPQDTAAVLADAKALAAFVLGDPADDA